MRCQGPNMGWPHARQERAFISLAPHIYFLQSFSVWENFLEPSVKLKQWVSKETKKHPLYSRTLSLVCKNCICYHPISPLGPLYFREKRECKAKPLIFVVVQTKLFLSFDFSLFLPRDRGPCYWPSFFSCSTPRQTRLTAVLQNIDLKSH